MPDTPDPSANTSESALMRSLAAEKAGALQPQDTVETAGDRMREHHAGTRPVAQDRKLAGVIDGKNPDWKIGGRGHDPKTWRVGQIMNRQVVFCYEDEDCGRAQKVMEEHGLRYLPVVDRQMRIVGVFSREEIQRKADASNEGPATG